MLLTLYYINKLIGNIKSKNVNQDFKQNNIINIQYLNNKENKTFDRVF